MIRSCDSVQVTTDSVVTVQLLVTVVSPVTFCCGPCFGGRSWGNLTVCTVNGHVNCLLTVIFITRMTAG